MQRRLLALPSVALALVAVGAFVWWRAPAAAAYRIERTALLQDVVATGRIITPSRVNIASEINALVVQRQVDQGDVVHRGQVLLQLRSDAADAQYAQAQAALQQLLTQGRPQAQAALRSTQSALELARSEAVRDEALFARGAVSRQTLDQARQALEAAQAQWRSAQAAWDVARPGGALEAQQRAALAAAAATRARTTLRAQIDGQVLTRNVEVGDTVVPGQVLFTLARAGATEVSVPVDEQNLEHLTLGQQARCTADAFPQRPFDARLTFIAPSIDTASGTIELRLTVARPPAWLRQDMTTSCDIVTGRRDGALVVPNDALREASGTNATVLVLRGGRARAQAVKLGLRGLTASEVVAGLQPGDLVIDDPDAQPGARLHAQLRALPAGSGSAPDDSADIGSALEH